jgi:antitoxin VapB
MGTPQLNIKDAETTALVRELVGLTGETQTEAVRRAVRERLTREREDRERAAAQSAAVKRSEYEKTMTEVRRIQEKVRALRLNKNCLTENDLYDENGLPK